MNQLGLGLYVHVPFCVRRCSYCDFYSCTEHRTADFEEYAKRVVSELEQAKHATTSLRGTDRLISIFLGGGTPSLLPVEFMARIFLQIQRQFLMPADSEITLEANPETVSREFLTVLRRHTPVNRMSLGAQSFKPENLKKLERLGSRESISLAVSFLKEFGLTNFNLDVIFGIPGQTLAMIQEDLNEAVALEPTHISAYSLSLRPGHPLHPGLPEEDLAAEQYELVAETLESLGYLQYEISNFARKGSECAHNLLYWSGGDFLGVGPSASSRFFSQGRFHHRKNISDFRKYLVQPFSDIPFESTTEDQTVLEALFLEIRRNEGIDLPVFESRYGKSLTASSKFDSLVRSHLIAVNDNHLRLTSKGRLLADSIALAL